MTTRTFALLAGVLVLSAATPSPAASKAPLGASCRNSTACESNRCKADVCVTYRGDSKPIAQGEKCQMSGECAMRKCLNNICGGPDAVKKPAEQAVRQPSSSPRPSSGRPVAPEPDEPRGNGKWKRTPCVEDLLAFAYQEDLKEDPKTAETMAMGDCQELTPEQIALAKKLVTEGYGIWGFTLDLIKRSPGEIECTKRDWKKRPKQVQAEGHIEMPAACKGK